MRLRLVPIGFALLSGFFAASACTLTVDLDPLENGECPGGQKLCDRKCVPLTDPKYGCSANSCVPCMGQYANMRCVNTECRISGCRDGRTDCDGRPENGCERDLRFDKMACGSCTNVCATANAEPDCSNSRCVIAACAAGYMDCNEDPADGCEVLTQGCTK